MRGTPQLVRVYFNPRPPWGGRHSPVRVLLQTRYQFQSTPSVGRATYQSNNTSYESTISIHALRGEGDDSRLVFLFKLFDFNPRPPWGGRRARLDRQSAPKKFQSTPSVGRATKKFVKISLVMIFQSTPSVGRATRISRRRTGAQTFQSTPSVGRAT